MIKHINKAELRKAIGQRLRFIRGKMTQAEFGKMFGKSQDSICAYEKGLVFPPLDVLIMVADYARAPLEWLIRGDVTDKGIPSEEAGLPFKGKLLKKGDPEWSILEMIINLPPESKEKIKLMVETAVNLEISKKSGGSEEPSSSQGISYTEETEGSSASMSSSAGRTSEAQEEDESTETPETENTGEHESSNPPQENDINQH